MRNAFFFTDAQLTLSGPNNILGRSLALQPKLGGPITACAPIIEEELVATTYFSSDVTIKQSSIFERSSLILGINYPSGNHHTQRILADAWMTNTLCSSNAATYNPFDARILTGR